MTVLVAIGPDSSTLAAGIRTALAEQHGMHDVDVCTLDTDDDVADPACVTHIVMWDLTPAELAAYPALEGILLMGAGFDHLDLDAMPPVPIIRLVDPAMATEIALYVLSWAIYHQRDFDHYARAQREARWRRRDFPLRLPHDVTVGVLGAGAIGTVVLDTLAAHGFVTIGWSRSNHDRPLLDFFADCGIVVDLLPSNADTHHFVGAEQLAALGDGVLINVGRGPTVDVDALITALDGDLRGAVLDVFDPEPLPADSPLWDRDDVIITPHISGRTDPNTAAAVMAANIARMRRGETPDEAIPRS